MFWESCMKSGAIRMHFEARSYWKRCVSFAIVMTLLLSGVLALADSAKADVGAKDSFGYYWVDNESPSPMVNFSWIEINSTGTDLGYNYGDYCDGPHSIGFTFNFYGTDWTQIYLNTEGSVLFYSSYPGIDWSNDAIPNSGGWNSYAAPYWDDLGVYTPGGHVYIQTIGSAPNRQCIVEWDHVTGYADPNGNELTFEAILEETSNNITFQYLDMNGQWDGRYATVGLENSIGSVGCQYSYNSPTIHDGLAIRFSTIPIAQLVPPYADNGVDADSDSYFEALSVNATVRVNLTGWYSLSGIISDGVWNYIGTVDNYTYLTAGTTAVELKFSGPMLYDYGYDGSYNVELYLYTDYYDRYLEDDSFVTGSYLASDFAQPSTFVPPYTDSGYDADANGVNDSLVIGLPVDASSDGQYTIEGSIFDGTLNYIGMVQNITNLTAGTTTVNLSFDGVMLHDYGYTGAYNLILYIYDDCGYENDYDTYTTVAYYYDNFEQAGAFAPPYSDYGDDTDGNVLFDYLVFEIPVHIAQEDWYTVELGFYDGVGNFLTWTNNYSYLAEGTTSVEIRLDGPTIYEYDYDGVFMVNLYLYSGFYGIYLAYDAFTTGSYLNEEFEPLGFLVPPYSDSGNDTDGNAVYDDLVIEVPVHVAEDGWYTVEGDLFTGSMSYITDEDNYTYLTAGNATVELRYDGLVLYNYGYDGAYEVFLYLYSGFYSVLLDSDSFTTGSYAHDEFESKGILAPPYNDYGDDDDGNGIYDDLVVEVPVHVAEEGWYSIEGDLYDGSMVFLNWIYNYTYLYEGTTTIELRYLGVDLNEYGYDGAYQVNLYLCDGYFANLLDTDSYTTGSYLASDFEPLGAFAPPFTEYGGDPDVNGIYDDLVIEAPVHVAVAGWYQVDCYLLDGSASSVTETSNYTYLDDGNNTVVLRLDGPSIYYHGYDGTYSVDLYLFDDNWDLIDSGSFVTGPYSASDFEPDGFLDPPYSDYGDDLDTDTLYEYLVIEVPVHIATEGWYEVYGELYNDSMSYMGYTYNYIYLYEGTSSVDLNYYGPTLYSYAYNGTYDVEIMLYDDVSNLLDNDSYVTGSYLQSDFNPGAQLDPPYSDNGADLNGNFLYDDLAVQVPIDVLMSSWYTVYGMLLDGSMNTVDTISVYSFYSAGAAGAELDFDGALINIHGYDGTYTVNLFLYTFNFGALVDTDTYTTGSYTHDEFERPPFFEGSNNDYGDDDNGDSLYDYLVVEVTVNATLDGWHWINGTCSASGESVSNYTYLTMGSRVVELRFNGSEINEAMINGTYSIALNIATPSDTSTDTLLYPTSAYTYDEFVDLTDPITAPSIIGTLGTNGWYVSMVNVTLSATDSSGIDYTAYSVDGGAWNLSYSDPITLSAEGNRTVEFYSVDNAGNVEETNTISLFVDRIAPTTISHSFNYTLFLAAVDDAEGSGVSSTHYRVFNVSAGTWSPWSAYGTRVVIGTTGDFYIEFYSIDNASNNESIGNLGNISMPIIDTTPPVTTYSLVGTSGENSWYVTKVNVTLIPNDAGCGVNYTKYRIDTGAWKNYTGMFTISSNGVHTVAFYSKDYAGNVEGTKTVTIRIDQAAPLLSLDQSNGATFNTTGVLVSWTASDATSGIDHFEISVDGGSFETLNATTRSKTITLTNGTHNVTLRAVDKAGHVTEERLDITVAIPPVIVPTSDILGMVPLLLVLIVAIAACIAVFFLLKRRKKNDQGAQTPPQSPPSA